MGEMERPPWVEEVDRKRGIDEAGTDRGQDSGIGDGFVGMRMGTGTAVKRGLMEDSDCGSGHIEKKVKDEHERVLLLGLCGVEIQSEWED